MTKITDAKAVISAEDKTGKIFDQIAAKFKGVEKSAKALAKVKWQSRKGGDHQFSAKADRCDYGRIKYPIRNKSQVKQAIATVNIWHSSARTWLSAALRRRELVQGQPD